MNDQKLAEFASAAGIAVEWRDVYGETRRVAPDTLHAVLDALGYASSSDGDVADGLARLSESNRSPAMRVVAPGGFVPASSPGRHAFVAADGREIEGIACDGGVSAPREAGYYRLGDLHVAVAPARAFTLAEVAAGRKLWGTAVQIYALNGGTTPGFGDFAALGTFVRDAAKAGAAAVAMSPVHALFGAHPDRYSPYAPSSRLFLNPLYAALSYASAPAADSSLIDWPKASMEKLHALRQAFDTARRADSFCAELDAFARDGGERLLAHARFEALDLRFSRDGIATWRDWPVPYRSPRSAEVMAMSSSDPEIAFQIFLQWHVKRCLADVQRETVSAGMPIGLIADVAVGFDPFGSHAWQAPGEILTGLNVGAPPDEFSPSGQDWGITALSPTGLATTGFESFIATLRASMGSAGGIRFDHAMSLMRLWVVPHGAAPDKGAYVRFPFDEMLGLLALESQRARCIVIAEDLGTVPPGFRERIAEAGLHGMRVLWFERDGGNGFVAPEHWDATAAALSTTHDLPTLAGWWKGRDIAWQKKARRGFDAKAAARRRSRDRKSLLDAYRRAGLCEEPVSAGSVTDTAFAFVAKTPCPLALFPLEDFLGIADQPNLPGTTSEHPNWRRRLPDTRPFDVPSARRRAGILNRERGG